MRKGNILILLLAIVMGGAAAFLANNWISAQTVASATKNGTIVVAAAPIPFGTALSTDNLAEIPWALGKMPEGAFASRQELLKDGRRVVLAPMQRNELVLKTKITGPNQRASLSSLLDKDKRAVTLRVDDVRGVAGFVMPGDRVDVVLIRNIGNENTSDVLLQHVKVLAVDQLVNDRQEKPTIAKAVTLEVDTDQAQKILLATNVGKLSLILRQAGEGREVASQRITERDLTRTPVAAAAPAPPPAPHSNTSTVTIIRNMKRDEYTVMRTN